MNEQSRLEKLRNLGVRLHELQLVQPVAGKSYTSVALNYLFSRHELTRPCGQSLDVTLRSLAEAIVQKHHLKFSRFDSDSIIDYFCRLYRAH